MERLANAIMQARLLTHKERGKNLPEYWQRNFASDYFKIIRGKPPQFLQKIDTSEENHVPSPRSFALQELKLPEISKKKFLYHTKKNVFKKEKYEFFPKNVTFPSPLLSIPILQPSKHSIASPRKLINNKKNSKNQNSSKRVDLRTLELE